MDLKVLKEELQKNDYSFASIADTLQLHKGTVSKIFNDIYTGKEETKIKVIKHCTDLIQKKPVNLSDDILNKSSLYERLMLAGSLNGDFKPEEREHFIKVYKELKQYNKNKLKKKAA